MSSARRVRRACSRWPRSSRRCLSSLRFPRGQQHHASAAVPGGFDAGVSDARRAHRCRPFGRRRAQSLQQSGARVVGSASQPCRRRGGGSAAPRRIRRPQPERAGPVPLGCRRPRVRRVPYRVPRFAFPAPDQLPRVAFALHSPPPRPVLRRLAATSRHRLNIVPRRLPGACRFAFRGAAPVAGAALRSPAAGPSGGPCPLRCRRSSAASRCPSPAPSPETVPGYPDSPIPFVPGHRRVTGPGYRLPGRPGGTEPSSLGHRCPSFSKVLSPIFAWVTGDRLGTRPSRREK